MRKLAWRYIGLIDGMNDKIGRAASWLALACVLTCCTVAVLRYAFHSGAIWLQELYVWFHALVFVIGAGYTLKEQGHVRVDLIHGRLTQRGRAKVEIFGFIVFLCPWLGVIGWLTARDAWGSLFPPNAATNLRDILIFTGWLLLTGFGGFLAIAALQRASLTPKRSVAWSIRLIGLGLAGLIGWQAGGQWGEIAGRVGEASAQTGGMPAIWLLKFALPAMILLIGLQALAFVMRAGLVLAGDETALPACGAGDHPNPAAGPTSATGEAV